MRLFIATLCFLATLSTRAEEPKFDAFKITEVTPGSVYDKLGLKSGDVLRGYNGKSIKGAKDFEELIKLLAAGKEKSLKLQVERAGKVEDITINFKK